MSLAGCGRRIKQSTLNGCLLFYSSVSTSFRVKLLTKIVRYAPIVASTSSLASLPHRPGRERFVSLRLVKDIVGITSKKHPCRMLFVCYSTSSISFFLTETVHSFVLFAKGLNGSCRIWSKHKTRHPKRVPIVLFFCFHILHTAGFADFH